MAKIAVELKQALVRRLENDAPGAARARTIAQGDGWTVHDVLCTFGPRDRSFEEQHPYVCIAVVAAGTFQYRSLAASELMVPGSLLLGNAGQCFECGHEHSAGDRCISFRYTPEYFENLAAGLGSRGLNSQFHHQRLPPLRAFAPLVAAVCAALSGSMEPSWEELSIRLAGETLQLLADRTFVPSDLPPSAKARVTRSLRVIPWPAWLKRPV